MSLKITHLSRLYDGWMLRFTGDEDAFDDMRDELKSWGRMYAKWTPEYHWRDNKKGAWWVDDQLLRTLKQRCAGTDLLFNLQEAMDAIRTGQADQWIAPRRASRKYSPPTRQIPTHLQQEYALLQISPDATLPDAKDAYRRLSKVHHPDTGGTHLGFIALQHAYAQVKRWLEHIERIAV